MTWPHVARRVRRASSANSCPPASCELVDVCLGARAAPALPPLDHLLALTRRHRRHPARDRRRAQPLDRLLHRRRRARVHRRARALARGAERRGAHAGWPPPTSPSCTTRSSTTGASTTSWATTARGSTRSARTIAAAAPSGRSVTACATRPTDAWRRVCRALLDRALPSLDWLRIPALAAPMRCSAWRTRTAALRRRRRTRAALRYLGGDARWPAYEARRPPRWAWFEDAMTYDNARLPEALLRAGTALGRDRLRRVRARESLAFYERVTFENGIFVPIGNDGWYRARRRARALRPAAAGSRRDGRCRACGVRRGRRRARASGRRRSARWRGTTERTRWASSVARGGGMPRRARRATASTATWAPNPRWRILAAAYAMAERAAASLPRCA